MRAARGFFTALWGNEQRQAATVVLCLAGLAAMPVAVPRVPERIVELPGQGWVDADGAPGVPASARDGDRLVLVPEASMRRDPAAVAADSPTASPDVPTHAAAFGRRLSLNTASAAELEALPGIGPALAARIVAGRPFSSVAELDRVKGIGEKTVARLLPMVEP